MLKTAVVATLLLATAFAMVPQATALNCLEEPTEYVECQTRHAWVRCPDGTFQRLDVVLANPQGCVQ